MGACLPTSATRCAICSRVISTSSTSGCTLAATGSALALRNG